MGDSYITGVKIEIRYNPALRSVSNDIARDIADNHLRENIVVASAGNAAHAHAAFRKQWVQVLRLAERERASTINPQTTSALARKITDMQALRFTTLAGSADSAAVVRFASVTELTANPQPCKIMYLTHPVDDKTLRTITTYMPANGLVVRYLRPELKAEYAAIQHPWRLPM
ncbi:MAG TPA: hypothetical protein VJ843_03255 [Candidatus Saccharimonadales bacterium]|nr:hypothetical protein [Candidatus Saccharimonadales bacterium]